MERPSRRPPKSAEPEKPKRGNLASTVHRRGAAPDHRTPTGRHARGRLDFRWKGTSRIVRPAERRRRNRMTWAKVTANARREAMKAEATPFVAPAHVVGHLKPPRMFGWMKPQ